MVQECRAAVKRAVVALKREQNAEKEQGKLAHASATE
jgi:hypothetical protein